MPDASDLTQLFAAEVARADPVRMALAIARIAYPNLDAARYLEELAAMAREVAPRVQAAPRGGARALALMQAMRVDLGLHGNTEHYYDAANSYLNIVIETRMGLPILLSLVLTAIGKKLGLNVDGAGFPGHFMARYEDDGGVWYLDTFHGAVMTAEDVLPYLVKLFGQSSLSLDVSYFQPLPPLAWAQRILNNLHAVYLNAGELEMLGKVAALMVVLEPERRELWQELGMVHYRLGELAQAARALRRFFYLGGYLTLSAPNSQLPPLPPVLDGAELHLWKLLEEIEADRIRWN
jgi:regulator of sirC expression with transglutaminase-like and TPR domain